MASNHTASSPHVFALSLGALALLWIGAAAWTADASVLPGPLEVLSIFWQESVDGPLAVHVAMTMARVAAAFALAMGIGSLLGIAMGLSPRVDAWIGPWVTIFLNVPALVVIVLCYLWIGLNEVAAVVAVAINKTAMVAVTLREGARSLDPRLRDLGEAYRMPLTRRLRHLVWPQLQPFVFAAMRNGIAIIWKIVLVVEFLGRPNGVGFQIHLYFQLFETGHVLAYALSFVAVMLCIEYLCFSPWERRSSAWRRAGASG